MGTEIVAYCASPILNDDGSESPIPSNTTLAKRDTCTKPNHRSRAVFRDTARDIKDLPHGLPRQRSKSIDCGARKRSKKKNSKSLRKYKANKAKHRRVSHANATEQEVDSMEIELRHKENAIKLLRKQNEYLRKQNEHFLAQYGSHFRTNSCGSHPNEKKTNSLSTSPTVDNASQISYSHSNAGSTRSMQTPEARALRIDITQSQNNERFKNVPRQPYSVPTKQYSPLTPLTPAQINIIRAFQNDGDIQCPNHSIAFHKKRSCSVPTVDYK
eukprot:537648_1